MHLISCNNCAAVLDRSKLKFADDIYTEEASTGAVVVNEELAKWDGDDYSAFVPCPVCQEPVFESQK